VSEGSSGSLIESRQRCCGGRQNRAERLDGRLLGLGMTEPPLDAFTRR
jgi:hypothetical protein